MARAALRIEVATKDRKELQKLLSAGVQQVRVVLRTAALLQRELSARLPKSGPNLAKRYAEPVWVGPPAGFTRMKSLSHLM